ncbi:MAG TPA: diguanylate cyclase [Nitrospiria bacterium]|nr:diguanylate cyclase [Nitrospiria bacterium]
MKTSGTAILNPELFNFLLELEVKKAARYSYFFSLLYIELDRDEEAEILETVANLIVDEIRDVDIVGKVEKQSFCTLVQAETRPTFAIGERIRGRILNYSFENPSGSRLPPVTISVGGACFPTHGTDVSELRNQAAAMLNKARTLGGNRVFVQGTE